MVPARMTGLIPCQRHHLCTLPPETSCRFVVPFRFLFDDSNHQFFGGFTLPETNSSHLKMDGWKTIVSFWEGLFSGAMLVLGRVYFEHL